MSMERKAKWNAKTAWWLVDTKARTIGYIPTVHGIVTIDAWRDYERSEHYTKLHFVHNGCSFTEVYHEALSKNQLVRRANKLVQQAIEGGQNA